MVNEVLNGQRSKIDVERRFDDDQSALDARALHFYASERPKQDFLLVRILRQRGSVGKKSSCCGGV